MPRPAIPMVAENRYRLPTHRYAHHLKRDHVPLTAHGALAPDRAGKAPNNKFKPKIPSLSSDRAPASSSGGYGHSRLGQRILGGCYTIDVARDDCDDADITLIDCDLADQRASRRGTRSAQTDEHHPARFAGFTAGRTPEERQFTLLSGTSAPEKRTRAHAVTRTVPALSDDSGKLRANCKSRMRHLYSSTARYVRPFRLSDGPKDRTVSLCRKMLLKRRLHVAEPDIERRADIVDDHDDRKADRACDQSILNRSCSSLIQDQPTKHPPSTIRHRTSYLI